MIKYFYVEALKENPDVDINLFTYPGPRPQSKITAILMILDSIEAASRTLDSPKREDLESLIDNIVNSKMSQGELNDSGLTLKDIEIIKRISFQKIIVSLHERIKYPELPEEKNEKAQSEENDKNDKDISKDTKEINKDNKKQQAKDNKDNKENNNKESKDNKESSDAVKKVKKETEKIKEKIKEKIAKKTPIKHKNEKDELKYNTKENKENNKDTVKK